MLAAELYPESFLPTHNASHHIEQGLGNGPVMTCVLQLSKFFNHHAQELINQLILLAQEF